MTLSGFGYDSFGSFAFGDQGGLVFLSAVASGTTALLTWKPNALGQAYEVHASHAPGDDFTVRAVAPPNATSLNVTDLVGGQTYYFRIRVRGADINPDAGTNELSVQTSGGSGVATGLAPQLLNLIPNAGSPLGQGTPLQFDVIDAATLAFVTVFVAYPSGQVEVAFDGDEFVGRYATNASRIESLDQGFRFTLATQSGWPDAPNLQVRAVGINGVTL